MAAVDDLRRLHEAATPGPWDARNYHLPDYQEPSGVHGPPHGHQLLAAWSPDALADADLVAAMRNALPALLDVAVSASQARFTLRAMLDHDELDSEAVRDAADLLDTYLARLEGGGV